MYFVKSYLLIIFLMCFFLHACNVRHEFGIATLEKSPLDKIKAKVEISMSYSPNVKDASVNSIPNNSLPKEAETPNHSMQKTGSQGNKDFSGSLHNDLPTEPEGSRSAGEKVYRSSILSEEDLLVTDYQSPHRKSPIHNK
ncbi:uncharacterized protein LOC142525568 [Primulina tabacum]|uniref:uncharacterized protein LOC142525568 n=1 Tax=Primulina tabacum TaxID=48773 RepID=UPI003F5910BD